MKTNVGIAGVLMFAGIALGTMVTGLPLAGQEKESENPIKELVELGPGVHKVKFNEDKSIKSLVVVGQGEIKGVLTQARRTMMARKAAEQNAKATLTQWMKENVMVVETSSSETVITTEDNGKELVEQGKAVDKTANFYASVAEAALSGLVVIGMDQNADEKITTVVYAWKPELSDAAAGVKEKMSSGRSPSATPAGSNGKGGDSEDREIKSKTAISEDAEEFL
jgi:hypothetical protein